MPAAAVLAVELVRRRETRVLATAAIAASLAVQIYGLTHLRYHKRVNAQITRITAATTRPGDIIVSDLYWFPQVTVTLYPTRRLLFAPSRAEIDPIAARAAEAGFREMWVVAVPPLTGYTPPPALASGFVHAAERDAGIGSVTFHQYVRNQ
jgi:xanthine/CO dehydrogenase XdhC/CoxF family maturation factor